ncbi:MAG: EamA family transporter [Chitinivibrionales bacterium]|nr:EamA family transporter [Chitinivibrionales bacterium]
MLLTLLPLASGFFYAFTAMAIKRSLQLRIDPWQMSFTACWAMAILYMPMLVWREPVQEPAAWWQIGLAAVLFLSGISTNFFALYNGDVSVATPVLGTKTLFVALFSRLIFGIGLTGRIWIGAVLVVIALALMRPPRAEREENRGKFALSIGFALISAGSFALCDVVVRNFSPFWSFGWLLPLLFWAVALLSCTMLPFFHKSLGALSRTQWYWLTAASILNAVQALGISLGLTAFAQANATRINILYSSRAIWGVLVVWLLGSWFKNTESHSTTVFIRRLIGAVLIVAAIVLAMME